MSKIKHVRLKLPEPSHPSAMDEDDSSEDESLSKVERVHLKVSPPSETSSPVPDDDDYSSHANQLQTQDYEALVNSLLYDSDLSDLPESSSEQSGSDSESDGSSSSSDQGSDSELVVSPSRY